LIPAASSIFLKALRPQSIAVMLRSCKAGSLVQIRVRAPIRSLSSSGGALLWYGRGGRFEASREHHAPVAQLAGGISLRTRAVRVRILAWRTILSLLGPRSPIGRGPALDAGQCRFEACRGYALVAQSAEAAASRAACCRFESCAAHQTRCSLRQAAKASGLHPDIRRFESVREQQITGL
jgi:hypothetical protein